MNGMIEIVNSSMQIGTSCLICDSFIPVTYPCICDECKKRLKKLLYESSKEGE